MIQEDEYENCPACGSNRVWSDEDGYTNCRCCGAQWTDPLDLTPGIDQELREGRLTFIEEDDE